MTFYGANIKWLLTTFFAVFEVTPPGKKILNSHILSSRQGNRLEGNMHEDNDGRLTSAIPDRLLNHADTVIVEGKIYRMKEQVEVDM